MKKLILSSLFAAGSVIAGGSGKSMASNSNANNNGASSSSDDLNWCGKVYSGFGFSAKGDVTNPSSVQFNTVASTDTDDKKLGKVGFIGVAVDRKLWSWVSAGVSFDMYTPFRYAAYHTGATAATGTGEVLSTNYQRVFNVSHQSALFNVNLFAPEDWSFGVGSMNISPSIGAGVGVGVSEVRDFHAIGYNSTATGGVVTTVALPNSKADVAWQASGGFKFQPEDSNVGFCVGYRYYYGGKFESAASYMLNDTTNTGSSVALTAWTGKIKVHEVRLGLDLSF